MNNSTFYNTYTNTSVPFTEGEAVFITVLLGLFLIVGVFGNTVMMIILYRLKALRSVYDSFVLFLCLADFISSLVSSINLYIRTWGYSQFGLPVFFCKLFWCVDVWTSYVSSFHILSYAIVRFIGVLFPIKCRRIKPVHTRIWIALIWLVTFLCGCIPMAILTGVETKTRFTKAVDATWPVCSQLSKWVPTYIQYTEYTYPIFFYIPMLATAVLSLSIAAMVLKRRRNISQSISDQALKRRIKKENLAFVQLSAIVGVFFVGYIPFTVFVFYATNVNGDTLEEWQRNWWFGTAQYICMRISDCLNPILYSLTSKKILKATAKLFKKRHAVDKS